jgi:hypothetical protein
MPGAANVWIADQLDGMVVTCRNETTIERQDAGAIRSLTSRRSCEDDRDGARIREQAYSARL